MLYRMLLMLLTHAEGAILHISIHTDTVIAANGVLTVRIHITDKCTQITLIDVWEWKIQNLKLSFHSYVLIHVL